MDKIETKVVYMIHQLKRHLIKLHFVHPTYAYDVDSDVNKTKHVRYKTNQTVQVGKLEITTLCIIFSIYPI